MKIARFFNQSHLSSFTFLFLWSGALFFTNYQYLLLSQGESSSLGWQCPPSRPVHPQAVWGTRADHPNLPPPSRAGHQCPSQRHSTQIWSRTSGWRGGRPEGGCKARPWQCRYAAELKGGGKIQTVVTAQKQHRGGACTCVVRQLCRKGKGVVGSNCVIQSLWQRSMNCTQVRTGGKKWHSQLKTKGEQWNRSTVGILNFINYFVKKKRQLNAKSLHKKMKHLSIRIGSGPVSDSKKLWQQMRSLLTLIAIPMIITRNFRLLATHTHMCLHS